MNTTEDLAYNVFVYGSLLPGLHNFPMAARALVQEPRPAVIHGFSLYSNHGGSFPYLAKGVAEGACGDVVGAILTLRYGQELLNIVSMEEGAGYNTSIVNADVTQEDGTVLKEDVIGFVHDESRAGARGDLVPDGDWKKYFTENALRLGNSWLLGNHRRTR